MSHSRGVQPQSEGEALIEPVNMLGLDAWTVHWDLSIHAIDALKHYLTKHSRVDASLRGTVVVV